MLYEVITPDNGKGFAGVNLKVDILENQLIIERFVEINNFYAYPVGVLIRGSAFTSGNVGIILVPEKSLEKFV